MADPQEQAFALKGDLDASDVVRIFRQSRSACRAGRFPKQIDLSELGQTDSSVLALMLEWQSLAHRQNSNIEFQSPPKSLRVLASLSQASTLFGWESERNSNADGDRS